MHHSAERVNVWGAYYFHPFDMVGWALLGSLCLVCVLGMGPEAALVVAILTTTVKEASVRRLTFGVTLLMLLSGIGAQYSARAMKENKVAISAEARKAVFRRAVEIWQQGRPELIDSVVMPNYVGHTSAGSRNIDGLRARITEFHSLYPDIKFTIEDQLAEGDRIATRMTASGTSKKTGKVVHLTGLNISRFVGDRIAEEWPVWELVR